MAEIDSSQLLIDNMNIILDQLKNDTNNNINLMADAGNNEMSADTNFDQSGTGVNIGPENASMTSQQMPFDFNANVTHMESHNHYDPNNSQSELVYQQMTCESGGLFPNACDAYTQSLMEEDGGFISILPINSLPISSVNINIEEINQSNIVNSSPAQIQPNDFINNVPGTSSASNPCCQFQPPSSTLSSGHFEENNIGVEPLAETTKGFEVNDNINTEEEKINQIIRAKVKSRNNPKNRTRGKIWIWDKPETKSKIIPELDLNIKRQTRSQTASASIRNPDVNYQVITIENARRTTTNSSTSSRQEKAKKPLLRSKKPKNKKNQIKNTPKKTVKKVNTTRPTTRSTKARQENAKKPPFLKSNRLKNKINQKKSRPKKLVKTKVNKKKDQNKGLSGTYLCCYCEEIYYYLNPFWYHFVAHEEEMA